MTTTALDTRGEHGIRLFAVGTAVLIAACALVLSYSGLHALALTAGVSPRLAVLLPVIVDGLTLVGSAGVVYSTLLGLARWYPWLLVLLGVAISVWGNWLSAPADPISRVVHAASPVILALVLEELLRVTRHRVASRQDRDPAVNPAQAPAQDPAHDRSQDRGRAVAPAAGPLRAPGGFSGTRTTPTFPVADRGTPDRTAATSAAASSVADPIAPADRAGAAGPVRSTTGRRDADASPTGPWAVEPETAAAETGSPGAATLREQVAALLAASPDLDAATIYKSLGSDPSYTRKIVRELRPGPASA